MIIDEEDAAKLKKFIVKKLENISDADSDVLADYVIALIRADTPESELRLTATEALEDFLRDHTKGFVDEVFVAILTRSYVPGYVPPPSLPSNVPTFGVPLGASQTYGSIGAGREIHGGIRDVRKRSYNDRQHNGDGSDPHYTRGDRHPKQLRSGEKAKVDHSAGGGGFGGFQQPNYALSHARSPPLPPLLHNLPLPQSQSFDPNDPLATMMALQAIGLAPLPGMPHIPQLGSPNDQSRISGQPMSLGMARERCLNYDMKGFCDLGDSCPYEHGTDRLVAPGQDEYDPRNSSLTGLQSTLPTMNGHNMPRGQHDNGYLRGHVRGRGDRGASVSRRLNSRAEFSLAGPNHDRSVTTIVVEQIPEEQFDEQAVRGFFSEFGCIEDVTMQPYKRLALVKYADYTAARRAYESPKVIFDNRFVKVYWYKAGSCPTSPSTAKDNTKGKAESFDREEFERNAQAAQRKLDEKKVQMKGVEAKRQALEKQKEELAQKQVEEKRKLLEKMAAKGIAADGDITMTDDQKNGVTGADDNKVSAHTRLLREKVAELEAEAKSLGLDAALSDYTPRGRGRGRGRGSYRGLEGFAGNAYRGSPRGRGGFGRGGGKYNLDNRTKKVGVSGVEWTTQAEESLKQYMLSIGEFETIELHTDQPGTQIVTFKDRATAEVFMYASKNIPGVGKLEFSWINAPSQSSNKGLSSDGDTGMGNMGANGDAGDKGITPLMDDWDTAEDFDVAE